MNKSLKPGMVARQSGIYRPSKGGAKVAISERERLPPTKVGGTFTLEASTKK